MDAIHLNVTGMGSGRSIRALHECNATSFVHLSIAVGSNPGLQLHDWSTWSDQHTCVTSNTATSAKRAPLLCPSDLFRLVPRSALQFTPARVAELQITGQRTLQVEM